MPECPICGRVNTRETGVPFPKESARFIRYCIQLHISAKEANKKAIICYDHFDPKDHIKEGDRIVDVARMAVPNKKLARGVNKPNARTASDAPNGTANVPLRNANTRMTLDQLLAKNVGVPPASTASQPTSIYNPSTSLNQTAPSSETGVFAMLHNQPQPGMHNSAIYQGVQRQDSRQANEASPAFSRAAIDSMSNAAKRTLVLHRRKKEGHTNSQNIDQKSVLDWIQQTFNVPERAVHQISQIFNFGNFQVVYLMLDELKTLESILAMYRSNPESYSCILNSAVDVLEEGAAILKKSDPTSSIKQMDINESFQILLQPSVTQFSDENKWRNLAAEMVPAFNNILAAASSQQQHQQSIHPNLATAFSTMNNTNFEGIPSSVQAIMHHIDRVTRQNGSSN